MRQTSHFLWRKPSAVRSGHLHLREGEITTNPVRRVHGRHSTGSPRVGTRPNTLRIGCTELKAVPHAGLGYHFPRVQVKPNGGWGSSNGSEAQSASTKSMSSDRQDDGGPCTSAELKGINGHQLRLTMRPGAPSRYVFTTAWMGLRWPMPSKCPWAPCQQEKTIQRNPCDYKGYTHNSL